MTPDEQERANEIFDNLQRIDAERLKQSAQNGGEGDMGLLILVGGAIVGGLKALFGGGE